MENKKVQLNGEILQLLNSIRTDWEVWANDEEVNILHKYAEQGRRITVVYTVVVCLFAVLYVAEPMVPKLIGMFMMNGSEVVLIPIPVDYYKLDMQKYFYYISVHLSICGFSELIVVIATDTMFIVYIHHGCAIFSALGHKLQQTGKNKKSAEIEKTMYVLQRNNVTNDHIVSCIDRHNDAIQYAELIEEIYASCLLFVVGSTVIGLTVTGYQIFNSSRYSDGFARYIAGFLIIVSHVYMDSYFCQMIMDHSIGIGYYIHKSNWYNLPSKDQKLLRFVIMRSNFPCKLTAGKFFVMSVETFTSILKMSLSYFTVLRSI